MSFRWWALQEVNPRNAPHGNYLMCKGYLFCSSRNHALNVAPTVPIIVPVLGESVKLSAAPRSPRESGESSDPSG